MGKNSAPTASAGLSPEKSSGAAALAAPALDGRAAWPYRRGWLIAAVIAIAVTGFASSFTYIWDCDIFWHLASGQWMLQHRQVLGTDPYSIDPQRQWVNVHWLFQAIIASVHAVGGFEALSVLKAAMAAGILVIFVLALRKHAPPALLAICALALLVTVAGRIRVRPESFTLLFLTITILLVDSVRRGRAGGRLWWMVPMMLLWVNMHGLFILGLCVLWSGVAGALAEKLLRVNKSLRGNLLSQQAILAAVGATVACFLTPWPLDAAAQPLLLWTRVSGDNAYFTYAVSELFPTYHSLGLYKGPAMLVAAALLALAVNFVLGLLNKRPRVPISHVLWLAAFAFLAALAKRNVALVGPPCAFLLVWHGADIIRSVRGGKMVASKIWPALTVIAVALSAAMAAGYATEFTFRKEAAPFRFGAGLLKEEFPIELATWLADLKADGDILTDDFGDASSFIYYCSIGRPAPARLIYMDGRLEAHDLSRFVDQNRIHQELQKPESAARVELPRSVRFVIARHSASGPLSALAQCPRFRLVRIDGVCAAFEDTQWITRNAGKPLPAADAEPNVAQFDRPLADDGSLQGAQPQLRKWWRQNPVAKHYRIGEMLMWLGQYSSAEARGSGSAIRYRCTLLAARYLSAAGGEQLMPENISVGMIAQAFQDRAYQNYYTPGAGAPVNMDLARSLRVYGRMDLTRLDDENVRRFAEQRLRTLLLAGQTDAADAAMRSFMAHLPDRERVSPSPEYFERRNVIQKQLAKAQESAAALPLMIDSLQRARLLTDPRTGASDRIIGLIDQAIAELLSAGDDDKAAERSIVLGDLFLRKGQVELARQAYSKVPGEATPMRLALCDWADGNFSAAGAALSKMAAGSNDPLLHFYLADLRELIGDYAGAREALAGIKSADLELQGLIDRLNMRLEGR